MLLIELQQRTFTTAKGSMYTITNRGTTIRTKAARPEHPDDQGEQEESEITFYTTDADANKLGVLYRQMKVSRCIVVGGNQATIKWLSGPYEGKLNPHALIKIEREPQIGLVPVELWMNGRLVHFGNKITEIH